MSESDWEDEPSSPKARWGEIPEDPDDTPSLPDVSGDIKKAMLKDCLDDYPDGDNVLQVKDLILPPMDPLMIYAIQLHKWMNNITETIRVAELAIEMNVIPSADAKPPIPTMPDIKLQHKLNNLNFMPTPSPLESTESDGTLMVPEISEAIIKKILIKCVATMTAHIGFEESFQGVLDVLVDVLEQFLIKICDRFVSALNEEETLNSGGFPNAMERVLVEMGFGGAKGLYDYYQCRILKYINVLQKRCQELDKHYSELLLPKSESPMGEIGKMFKAEIKEEEEQLEPDSEMHFTEGDVFTTGYQLLNSLEAVANMQGLSDTEGF